MVLLVSNQQQPAYTPREGRGNFAFLQNWGTRKRGKVLLTATGASYFWFSRWARPKIHPYTRSSVRGALQEAKRKWQFRFDRRQKKIEQPSGEDGKTLQVNSVFDSVSVFSCFQNNKRPNNKEKKRCGVAYLYMFSFLPSEKTFVGISKKSIRQKTVVFCGGVW